MLQFIIHSLHRIVHRSHDLGIVLVGIVLPAQNIVVRRSAFSDPSNRIPFLTLVSAQCTDLYVGAFYSYQKVTMFNCVNMPPLCQTDIRIRPTKAQHLIKYSIFLIPQQKTTSRNDVCPFSSSIIRSADSSTQTLTSLEYTILTRLVM